MWFLIAIFGVLGVIQVISPRSGWWLANFWRFEGNAEPSSFSLLMYRLAGAVYLIVAVVLGSHV